LIKNEISLRKQQNYKVYIYYYINIKLKKKCKPKSPSPNLLTTKSINNKTNQNIKH